MRQEADVLILDEPTAALDAEVRGSAEDLAELLGVRPLSFAYPYGDYTARVSAAVRSVFALALTCVSPNLGGDLWAAAKAQPRR